MVKCPNCGSQNLKSKGYNKDKSKKRFKCKDCGKDFYINVNELKNFNQEVDMQKVEVKEVNFEQLAEMFSAISNPVRLRILFTLNNNEQFNVSDLTKKLNIGQSTLSQHLRILKFARLVDSIREGSKVYYYLSPEANKIIKIIQEVMNG